MLHDAQIEATCDGDGCQESVFVELEYVYHSTRGESGQYNTDDDTLEATLEEDHGWIVRDGNHFCCPECAGEDEQAKAA